MGSGGAFYLHLGEKARLELSLNAARWKLQACTCVHVRGQGTCITNLPLVTVETAWQRNRPKPGTEAEQRVNTYT